MARKLDMPRTRSIVSKSVPLALLASLVASLVCPLAPAQTVFKCVGENGADLYRNSPCPSESASKVWVRTDSQGASAPAPRSATGETAAPRDEPRLEIPALPVATVNPPAETAPSTNAMQGELRTGMTAREVKATLGQPAEITDEEVVEGRVQTWSYPGAGSLQFDASGRLSAAPR